MPENKSLEKVIPAQQFLAKLETQQSRFLALADYLTKERELGQSYYAHLESEAHSLETFMDNHMARGNSAFAYLTELIACVRWVASTAHSLSHLQIRYENYATKTGDVFLKDLSGFLLFCHDSLRNLHTAIWGELKVLGANILPSAIEEQVFMGARVQEYLVQDVDERYCGPEEEQKIIEGTFMYVDVADRFAELIDDGGVNEDIIEEFTSSFHRIQTKYDSYISGTEEENKDLRLKTFRGHISLSLHLLEAALYMLHFYERHVEGDGPSEIKSRIAEMVNPTEVTRNVKVTLFHANESARQGVSLARDLLRDYADMKLAREKVIIPKGSILHLRPATALVEPVIQCASPVLLEIDGKRVRANSVLEIISVMGQVADKIEHADVEMVLQGDEKVVRQMKENFLNKILETRY